MADNPQWRDEADIWWCFRDEQMHTLLENKYADRKRLATEAEQKRQAVEKMEATNPLYHRAAVSSEMAQMRFEMAYLIDKNRQLAQYIETIEYLHQRVGIIEGAYGGLKLLLETANMQNTIRKRQPEEPAK